ncbi:MAG: hypothetical protein PHU46_18225 [Rhodocyclaceae bacterium]|nr:hypothetical protein [Rhodocyclaceae bacterium]
MTSPATCRVARPATEAGLAAAIAAQKRAILEIERELWRDGLAESRLDAYQAAFRQLERLLDQQGADDRHEFVVVIPVADRPQHLRGCLDSLLELCRAFGYGGQDQGRYRKISVVVADDSNEAGHVAQNREMARHYSRLGLATTCFGPDEQIVLVDSLGQAGQNALSRILGNAPPASFGHKGQGVMRNIAYLELNEQARGERRVLFYSIDSDQEFKVKVATKHGDRDVCAVNFFFHLDEIFSTTDALVLTGKVVGDPPVSPAVMTSNFLDDVIAFLRQMAAGGAGPCRHHRADPHRQGEAAYHDMADLFGFKSEGEAYRYRCPLRGIHGDADCFDHFGSRVNSFFYGEHPTRASYYLHDAVLGTVQPARTVYAGNYVFRPEGLKYFIPFASLRLRMSGPTLGRLIKSEIGPRFVSANLPMLHKRTVSGTGQSEFRPGLSSGARAIDFGGEFERQFYGDVMLFSIERLTAMGFPRLPETVIGETLATVRQEMLEKYNGRRQAIMEKLEQLQAILQDDQAWWNRSSAHGAALRDFEAFADNVARNFGDTSTSHLRINSEASWDAWRGELLSALCSYPEDRRLWEETLAARRRAP